MSIGFPNYCAGQAIDIRINWDYKID